MASGLGILVDSSAWIAMLRGLPPWLPAKTDKLLAEENLLVADLVYVEVVRGARSKAEGNLIKAKLNDFEQVGVCTIDLAKQAVEHHHHLRSKGITIRGTVDLMIATWCIENGVPLLHADRDFAGFEEHLGLKRWPMVELRDS
jgi:predicted nucleic acid-binding protein